MLVREWWQRRRCGVGVPVLDAPRPCGVGSACSGWLCSPDGLHRALLLSRDRGSEMRRVCAAWQRCIRRGCHVASRTPWAKRQRGVASAVVDSRGQGRQLDGCTAVYRERPRLATRNRVCKRWTSCGCGSVDWSKPWRGCGCRVGRSRC